MLQVWSAAKKGAVTRVERAKYVRLRARICRRLSQDAPISARNTDECRYSGRCVWRGNVCDRLTPGGAVIRFVLRSAFAAVAALTAASPVPATAQGTVQMLNLSADYGYPWS